MPAHLRALSRCRRCGAPATEQLFNTFNAPLDVYCAKHAAGALKAFEATTTEGEQS